MQSERSMPSLFGSARMRMDESLDLTRASLQTYGERHPHWAIAWSGGKDSSALVTIVLHLIESGQVAPPESLTVLYADTRLELLPLYGVAAEMRSMLEARGHAVRTVMAPLDRRFFVYMLGRGVPPPNNMTLRWCTRQIKIEPMVAEMERLYADVDNSQLLMLTGVRQGESAIRDGRIAMSCGINGAECGQGWYQETLDGDKASTLAPMLHWRVCHVWDWLSFYAPRPEYGAWPTMLLADAYGGDEAQEINARTGCVGCPLAQKDRALEAVVQLDRWSYLEPLMRLRAVYTELRRPCRRLRQPGGEKRADGTLIKNQQRMGPLTMEARLWALAEVLAIQSRVNESAVRLGRPSVDILNREEVDRINALIADGTWPRRWTGAEPRADKPMDQMFADGTSQPLLPGLIS